MFRRTRAFSLASALVVAGLLGAACSDDSSDDDEASSEEESDSGAQTGGGTLAAVTERGTLNCGVNNSVPGFGFETADGIAQVIDFMPRRGRNSDIVRLVRRIGSRCRTSRMRTGCAGCLP